MKKLKLIFTAGLFDDDDHLMKNVKGWRGDILVENYDNNFYELFFIDIERLNADIDGMSYFFEANCIIVNVLSVDNIIKVVQDLNEKNFFKKLKPVEEDIERSSEWTVIDLRDQGNKLV